MSLRQKRPMRRAAMLFATVATPAALGMAFMRPAAFAQTVPTTAAAAAARDALTQARGEAARARERAALLDSHVCKALAARDRASLSAAALAARVQQSEAALAAAQAELALVRQARDSLASRLARESAPVTQLMAALQTQVRRPAMLQLIQPGSITDAVHLRAALVAIEPQIMSRTAVLRQELARQRNLEHQAANVARQQRNLQRQLHARRSELAALSAAQRLKARRASSAADREAERAFALSQDVRDISTLISRLEDNSKGEAKPAGPFSTLAQQSVAADQFAPRRLPVNGRPAAVQPSSRRGLTLQARPGALVVAPGAGRVAFAGPYRGYGIIVILEHRGGWTSLITGLAVAEVARGQTIAAGYPLGQAAARDPLITVELRRNGLPVDPSSLLR